MKLLVMVAMFLTAVLIHNFNVMMFLTIGTLLLFAWCGHPWKRLLLYASPFLLIFVSTALGMMFFGKGSTSWFKLGLIHVTEESFFRGLHLGFRSVVIASSGLLFSLTTRPVMLFYALMQQWRVPPKYAYSFLAGLRMIPIVWEEFMTLRHAIQVRGIRQKGVKRIFSTVKMYSIPLLAQSIRRAQRISVAMQARRFSSGSRTYYYSVTYSRWDAVFPICFAAIIAGAWMLGHMLALVDITDVRRI